MNKSKLVVWMLRLLLLALGFATVIGIIWPTYRYYKKSDFETSVDFRTKDTSQSSSYDWIKKHNKISEDVDNPELIIINSPDEFDDDFISRINQNTIIVENLYNQIFENKIKSDSLLSLTGVSYSGFIGKTYFDLSDLDKMPQKIVDLYETQTNKKWKFSGEGIVVNNGKVVIVLKKGKDYRGNLMVVEEKEEYQFTGYFEITKGNSEVVASFRLNTTEMGEEKLQEYQLSNNFPALYSVKSTIYNGYYFAGNFSDTEISLPYGYEAISDIMKHKLIYDREANEKIYWKWYYPRITKLLYESHDKDFFADIDIEKNNRFVVKGKEIFFIDENEVESPYFIKGVNLGSALPGKTFTEFPKEKEIYLEWFEDMGKLNVNTVRIYTLLPPVFYEALFEYNKGNDNPLYLLQEIWPEEHPLDSNYLAEDYNDIYRQEIEYVVHAVHGNINIPKRNYRAYGIFRYDVSDYLIGYLVGREMEPEEVRETDLLNKGYEFKGTYLSTEKNASPTEGWLASSCDYTLEIEDAVYNKSPLIAIVSWPTLDEANHDSEWNESEDKNLLYNDSEVVDIDNINIDREKVAGFFGAYHIYPNYPDFMNNEKKYSDYNDEEGRFRYGGYLKEFMVSNDKYPAIVAEYGISTSMYTAHISPDGYNHGGLSEKEQAEGIIRMTKSIINEGYSGAVIFEWMDEWAKKTWSTENYMIPYSQNPFWHNVMDPEQNYGILAFESEDLKLEKVDIKYSSSDNIEAIYAGQNSAYVYLNILFENNVEKEPFDIAISTVVDEGESDYYEFLLKYGDKTKLLVNPGYNWLSGHYKSGDYNFDSYEMLVQLVNKQNKAKDGSYIPSKSINLSELKLGSLKSSLNHIEIVNNSITIRLPYGLLGISDPTSNNVLSDEKVYVPLLRDSINTEISDSIKFKLVVGASEIKFDLPMNIWDTPKYRTRMKDSFEHLREYFKTIK